MIDHERFENDHTYHLFLQQTTLPYSEQYYDILEKFLENNKPTEIIFENFFGKLFCFMQDEIHVIKKLDRFLEKFSNIIVEVNMLGKIFSNLKSEKEMWEDDIEAGYKNLWCNKYVIGRIVYILYKLYTKKQLNITLDNLYVHVNKINWKFQSKKTFEILKKIFTKIYENDRKQNIRTETLNYIFKYCLIRKFIVNEQYQYEMLYKYYLLPKSLDDRFKFTVECLENACEIKNNVNVVNKLLQVVKPNLRCLDNALKFKSNNVVKLLLPKIKATKTQIIQYYKKYNDDTLLCLLENYTQE